MLVGMWEIERLLSVSLLLTGIRIVTRIDFNRYIGTSERRVEHSLLKYFSVVIGTSSIAFVQTYSAATHHLYEPRWLLPPSSLHDRRPIVDLFD